MLLNLQEVVEIKKEPGKLPDTVEIAVGMRIMVTTNINTDREVANGARGTVVEIILDAQESTINSAIPNVELGFLPACILVKLDRTSGGAIAGLEEGIIPIFLVERSFQISMKTGKKAVTKTIKRWQYRTSLLISHHRQRAA